MAEEIDLEAIAEQVTKITNKKYQLRGYATTVKLEDVEIILESYYELLIEAYKNAGRTDNCG